MKPINLTTIRPIILQDLELYALNLLTFYFVYFKARKISEKFESEKTSPTWIQTDDLADSSRRV